MLNAAYQQDMFDPPALNMAKQNAHKFTDEFLEWLPENLHVWNAFAKEALNVVHKGFNHYSAYTIVEFLRHHSAVFEIGGPWKINNNYRPYLARLFDLMYPTYAGLFEFRETKKVTAEKGIELP